MADLDNLLGSRISLITTQDVRYDGILFTINALESSIVLREVHTLGTEERITDVSKKVAASDEVMPFVSFPGYEIKDLYVHEPGGGAAAAAETLSTPPEAKKSPQRPPKVAQTQQPPRQNAPRGQGQGKGRNQEAQDDSTRQQQQQQPRQPREPAANQPAAGTGAHLLKLKVKKSADGANTESEDVTGEFDFSAGLDNFNKDEVLAKVAAEGVTVAADTKYKKDDFFDSLSNAGTDRTAEGFQRRSQAEERNLNQDTFGAIAIQSNNYRRGGYRGGGRVGGSEGGRGRGRGGGRGRGRGQGQGGRGYQPSATPTL